MIVDSIMTRSVITIGPDASVLEAARLMQSRGIGGLIVTRGAAPVGVVTERDLVSRVLAAGRNAATTPVREVMSAPVLAVEPTMPVDEAVELMAAKRVKRLVVALGDEVRGIVTVTDIALAKPEISKRVLDTWIRQRWED